MTNAAQEILASARAALEKAERDAVTVARVAELLPAGVAVEKIHPFAAYALASVVVPVRTRAEVIDVLARFDALPAFKVKDGCLSFRPLVAVKDRERERADISEVAPVVYTAEVIAGYPVRAHAEFYAELKGACGRFTVRVRCEIETDAARVTYNRRAYRYPMRDAKPHNLPDGRRIDWMRTNAGASYSVYWRTAEEMRAALTAAQ